MKIEVDLEPFSIPNFVRARLPITDKPMAPTVAGAFPLSKVEAHALSEMCDVFRAAVFKKAGKEDPRPPK